MIEKPHHDAGGHNLPVLSVGEISGLVKRTVEESFAWVRVRGEMSGFKRAASGHLYFSLKDENAVLEGVCWRGTANRLAVAPEDGMEVVATGRITTYPGRSKYQIVVEQMELAGEGALLKLLEERRRKLAAEGLFADERKQSLPFLPETIGVATSPTGAVIRDILHRLADRFPRRVLVWPVAVQGENAARQVADAVAGFDAMEGDMRPDLVIVARGGGSLEDLMAFNEETVVRAVAACSIPLISAVGHETDVTLIDHAADVRAPTPTAAAEMAVPVRIEIAAQVADDGARLSAAMARMLEDGRVRLEGLGRGLPDLARMVDERAQRLDDWGERLGNALSVGMDRRARKLDAARLTPPTQAIALARGKLGAEARALGVAGVGLLAKPAQRLERAGALLESYSHQRVLERGFALVRDEGGDPVTSRKAVKSGMALDIRFHDGDVRAVADARPRKAKKSKPDDRQGSLL